MLKKKSRSLGHASRGPALAEWWLLWWWWWSLWLFTPANVEVVGESKDGDEELADLEGAVVEQFHRLLSQVAFFAVIRLLENSDLLIFSFFFFWKGFHLGIAPNRESCKCFRTRGSCQGGPGWLGETGRWRCSSRTSRSTDRSRVQTDLHIFHAFWHFWLGQGIGGIPDNYSRSCSLSKSQCKSTI